MVYRRLSQAHTRLLTSHLAALRFTINITFIGLSLDSVTFKECLSVERVEAFRGLSGPFLQKNAAEVHCVPLPAGSDGVSTGCHPSRSLKHEAVSVVGCVAQTEPDAPLPTPGFGFHG